METLTNYQLHSRYLLQIQVINGLQVVIPVISETQILSDEGNTPGGQ